MVHAVLYVLFSILAYYFLKSEFKKPKNLFSEFKWVIASFIFGTVLFLISDIVDGVPGNLILHASGGFSAVLILIYLKKTFGVSLSFKLTLIIIFGFVSMLGVLNELLEYGLELASVDVFSFDTHDTWRDLSANTAGGIIASIIFFKQLFRI